MSDAEKELKHSHIDGDNGQSSQSGQGADQKESPWNLIIVNQIPSDIDRGQFMSIFSQYGKIENVYLSSEFARITYSSEEEANKVWEASQGEGIKYHHHTLAITQLSDDYCPIEILPDDCLREIFSRLELSRDKFNCELMSARWKSVVEKCWTNVTHVTSAMGDIRQLIPRAKNSLRKIYLSSSDEATTETLRLMAENCRQIERFYMYEQSVLIKDKVAHLLSFIQNNKNLRSIQLDFCRVKFGTGFDLTSVLPDKLERLILTMRGSNEEMVISMDFSKFTNLQVLNIVNASLYRLELHGIENLVNVRKLKLGGYGYDGNNIEGIRHLTNLEYLAISGDYRISNEVCSAILRNNEKLTYLDLNCKYNS